MQYETLWHAAKHIRTVKSEFDILQFIQNNEFRLFFAWIGSCGTLFWYYG